MAPQRPRDTSATRNFRRAFFSAVAPFVAISAATLFAAEDGTHLRQLDSRTHHLGVAGDAEWKEFEGKTPAGRSLELKFDARTNGQPATLLIRQHDVKLKWPVLLNGRRLGWLELNENRLVAAIPVPALSLRDGENTLSILSPEMADDIVIGDVRLDNRLPETALHEATVRVHVMERGDNAVPCRITVVDMQGYLAPIHATSGQALAVRTGVIYTGNGHAEFGLPAGDYMIYATRGFEYGVDSRKVSVAAGSSTDVELQIAREVPTPGLVACDTHIHTLTLSGHGDATVEERTLTLAGEGVELAIATEHNRFADYTDVARRMNVADYFTCAIGNEVTTKRGHFIAFPIDSTDAAIPDASLADWPALMTSIRAVPGVQIVVLNHPRDVHNGFIPFDEANFNPVTGENLRGVDYSFDAIEVANSGTLQSDFMRSFRDWFALLNRGYRVTAVGSSDSHDVSRFIVGQGRTYIETADGDPGSTDVSAACRALKAGRAGVSLGLLTSLVVDGKFKPGDLVTVGDTINVSATVLGPSWTVADKLELFANGVKIQEYKVESSAKGGVKASIELSFSKPAHDVHLVSIASGPGVKEPFWPIPSPYQPTDRIRQPRVIGVTNPIWLDVDGDRAFTSARAYAERLVKKVGAGPEKLVPALADYDESVAAHAAAISHAAGENVRAAAFATALDSAASSVRNGFAAFISTLPEK